MVKQLYIFACFLLLPFSFNLKLFNSILVAVISWFLLANCPKLGFNLFLCFNKKEQMMSDLMVKGWTEYREGIKFEYL